MMFWVFVAGVAVGVPLGVILAYVGLMACAVWVAADEDDPLLNS